MGNGAAKVWYSHAYRDKGFGLYPADNGGLPRRRSCSVLESSLWLQERGCFCEESDKLCKKRGGSRKGCLAGSVGRALTLELGVVSSNPTVGGEITK